MSRARPSDKFMEFTSLELIDATKFNYSMENMKEIQALNGVRDVRQYGRRDVCKKNNSQAKRRKTIHYLEEVETMSRARPSDKFMEFTKLESIDATKFNYSMENMKEIGEFKMLPVLLNGWVKTESGTRLTCDVPVGQVYIKESPPNVEEEYNRALNWETFELEDEADHE